MKFSITISSYMFQEFVELNLCMVRKVFGESVPILISDDWSVNSAKIEDVARKHSAAFIGSRKRKNHFAGDLQGVINSLAFAKSVGADVAVKISLRLILLDPKLKDVFTEKFSSGTNMIVPCKVKPDQLIRRESITFSLMPLLSDIIMLRVGCIEPQELIDLYRKKVTTERAPYASLIEALICDLHFGRFNQTSYLSDELGRHQPGMPHRFLRKCQNNRVEYIDLARSLGIEGEFRTEEWSRIQGVLYQPRPMVL